MSLKNNIYYTDDYIKQILFTTKSIAVVGLSDKENRPSNFAAKYLKNRGYKIIPINPVTSKKVILGEKVYKTISELNFVPDMVDLFVKKEKILEFVKEAIKIKTKTIWLQLGLIDILTFLNSIFNESSNNIWLDKKSLVFKIDFKTSFACKEPIIPATGENIPSV